MSTTNITKAVRDQIAIVINQTSGGGPVYAEKVISKLKRMYGVKIYSPDKLTKHDTGRIGNLVRYLLYVYIYLPRYYSNLRKTLNDSNYKKVIVFQDSYIKTPPIFTSLKIKNVYICHEPPREFYEDIKLHTHSFGQILFTYTFRLGVRYMDLVNMRNAKIVVVNSKYSKNVIDHIYSKNSVVIYPGFDCKKRLFLKRQKVCISIGSLHKYKGHEKAITAISMLDKEVRPKLVIVGSGEDSLKVGLLNLADKLGVNIKLYSWLTEKELIKLYSVSSIYINAAQFEPFGMTSLEAIGYGSHLITNNTGGTKELYNFFKERVTVCKNDARDMSIQISKKLNAIHRDVPDMKAFSWESVAKKIDSL